MFETIVVVTVLVPVALFAIAINQKHREAVRIPVRVGKPRRK